jgi:hypothetical protein
MLQNASWCRALSAEATRKIDLQAYGCKNWRISETWQKPEQLTSQFRQNNQHQIFLASFRN